MAMKPQLVQLLEAMKAQNLKPMHELSPADARKQMADSAKARSTSFASLFRLGKSNCHHYCFAKMPVWEMPLLDYDQMIFQEALEPQIFSLGPLWSSWI